MLLRPVLFASIFTLTPVFAFAQEDDEEMPEPAKAAPAAEEKKAEAAPLPPEQTQSNDPFKIRRGFFAQADLGVFLTFGGYNSNNTNFPSRVTSNLQPHLGVVAGYDIVHTDKFNFAFGLRLAMGLSGGASRITSAETQVQDPVMRAEVATHSNDYSVIETGGQATFSFLVSDRVALLGQLDGGLAVLDPDPSKTAGTEGAGTAAFGATFGAGFGVELYTRLNDFSIGALLRFQGTMLDGFIPGASVTIPIKYTF